MKTNEKLITLVLVTLSFAAGVWVFSPDKSDTKNTTSHEVKEVVGKTWGWAKLMTMPARVEIQTDGPQAVSLSQVEFQVSDTEIKTAFLDTRMFFPTGGFKIGDEVLIAEVPGRDDHSGIGYNPIVTYFVVDYRKAGSTNSLAK